MGAPWILVHGDYHLRPFIQQMLERAGNSQSYAKFRLHRFAGSPDLAVGGQPAGVHGRAGSADICLHQPSQFFNNRQVFFLPETAAYVNQDFGLGYIYTLVSSSI
jgi:hypothetical protein